MKLIKLLPAAALALVLTSCASKRIAYFQDMQPGTEEKVLNVVDVRVKPDDKISIVVKSKDPQLSNLFNLPIVTQRVGERAEYINTNSMNGIMGYTIDKEGNIDFPVLGMVHVEGMNRQEISKLIKKKLVSKDLVKDPVVTVEFVDLTFSVLGEVKNPGRYNITKDRLTLMDAISMAGDLTIHGKRENVMVQREEGGKRKLYKVNLESGYDLYGSPVYYLQQNDVVYVEPNKEKVREANVNNNAFRWASILISVASLVTSIVAIVK